MKFIQLSQEKYESFLLKHEQKTFLHTPMIGKLRREVGWDFIFLGVESNNNIIAATMLLSKKIFFNKKEFYAIRGFLIDYNNIELLSFFVKNIKNYAKKNNGFVLKIDPYLIKQQRDINGEIVPNGKNNLNSINNLKKLGFKEVIGEQAKWMFVLDIAPKNIEELFKQMKPNTRSCINKTFKTGITVRELKYEELEIFHHVIESTGERRHFSNKKLNYYQKMYKLFKKDNQIKFLIAELNTKKYLDYILQELSNREKNFNKISKLKTKEIEEEMNAITGLKNKLVYAKKMEKKEKSIILSAAMFILYGDEIVYLSSGSYQEHMNLCAQYRIQYEIIKYAAENNYKKYNFYGISGKFSKDDPKYGIYSFKKGFGGYVVELIGEFQIPLRFISYYIYSCSLKFKNFIKQVIHL